MTVLDKSKAAEAKNVLQVRRAYTLPVDPLHIRMMPDYDLSLLMFRTWFNYDEGRSAQPGLIKSWRFEPATGTYFFTIDPAAKWSNGKQITSDELFQNIRRAIDAKTSYGLTFNSIVNLSSFEKLGANQFSLQMKDKKPSAALFQRLGSIFLAVTSPLDFSNIPSQRLKSNTVSAGPFVIDQSSEEEITFIPNTHFNEGRSSGPTKIIVRKPEPEFDLMKFLDGKTWENLTQLTTIIPPEAAKKIFADKIPYWTRGHDRVSLLKPLGHGRELKNRRAILREVAAEFANLSLPPSDLKVMKARSLQPPGYPLVQDLVFPKSDLNLKHDGPIKILRPNNYYGEFHEKTLAPIFKKLGLNVEWKSVAQRDFVKATDEDTSLDFVLINFGVADPEPTTWVSLIFEQSFVSFDKKDEVAFKEAAALNSPTKEIKKYKAILKDIAGRGGYLPLFHFSTLAIARKGISFKDLHELDGLVRRAVEI